MVQATGTPTDWNISSLVKCVTTSGYVNGKWNSLVQVLFEVKVSFLLWNSYHRPLCSLSWVLTEPSAASKAWLPKAHLCDHHTAKTESWYATRVSEVDGWSLAQFKTDLWTVFARKKPLVELGGGVMRNGSNNKHRFCICVQSRKQAAFDEYLRLPPKQQQIAMSTSTLIRFQCCSRGSLVLPRNFTKRLAWVP